MTGPSDVADDPALAALLPALDGVGFVLDGDDALVEWNDRLSAVTGHDADDLAGTAATDLVAPGDRERAAAAIAAVRETGRTTVEAALLTDAGTTLPYTFSARRLDGGGIVGVGRPVGERAHLRERLAADAAVARLHDHCEGVGASFAERVDAAIGFGRERLGMAYGFLTRIDGDVQEVLMAQGTHDLLQPGETCPLSEAYCRKTIREETLLGVQDAVADGWGADRAYEAFELGSYIGAKVVVDGSLFGTLCFADDAPREAPFTEADETAVELLAAWTSHELAERTDETAFAQQQARVEEFASMVSHDLRNPLSVASGRLSMADDGEHVRAARDALDRMEALIGDMLALVRGGETVEGTRAVDAEAVAREAWSNVDTADATLSVEPFTVEADHTRLLQLLENLFRNAVEHAGPDVAITVGPTADGRGFSVADDGPGIDEGVRERVFERGFTTDDDGTGLGLNIVRSIAGAHGWRIHAEESDAGGARFVVSDAEVAVPAE